MSFVSTEEGERWISVTVQEFRLTKAGPFHVRALASFLDNDGKRPGVRRLDVGEVIEVSATKYVMIRGDELAIDQNHGAGKRRYEPVSDDTPLRGPILPDCFPSHYPKAKAQAARGLEKPESELTFAEIVKFFEKKKSNAEVVK